MTVKTLPDVTPNGTATPISALLSPSLRVDARWVQLSANGTTIRYGDSSVSATRGARIANGTQAQIGFGFQEGQGVYDLTQIYVFATGSDSVSITFAV